MILCGTDFSPAAREAARVAAALALASNEPVHLLHVLAEDAGDESRAEAAAELAREVADLQRLGAVVSSAMARGFADELLREAAAQEGVRGVVVSSHGRRGLERLGLGSVAERMARYCPVPLLVVRGSGSFSAWLSKERPLRVLLGVDFSRRTQAAVAWLERLRRLGPVDVTAVTIAFPPEQQARLGLTGPLPLDHLRPEVERQLQAELHEFVPRIEGEGNLEYKVVPGWGAVGSHLADLAVQADMVLVGQDHWRGMDRLWHSSVAQRVVREARVAVALIPAESEQVPACAFHKVLVTTDLTPEGNQVVAWAAGMVWDAGTLYVMHVTPPKTDGSYWASDPDPSELRAMLRTLVPEEAARRGVQVVIRVEANSNVADEICVQAERLGVDGIAVGSGRSSMEFLFGSTARTVMGRSRRPVLVVPRQVVG